VQSGSTANTTFTVTGLTPDTTYQFYVVARDAAGNTSAQSNTVAATTEPTGGGGGGGGPVFVVASTALGFVRVIDPNTNATFLTVQPFNRYVRLVSVALGDVNGDGTADIICTTRGQKNGRVKVYDGEAALNGQAVVLSRFRAFADYTGGLTVASADVDGDGRDDIIVGSGRQVAGRVAVFSGANLPPAQANADVIATTLGPIFNPFGPSFTGGVYVAAGDLDNDGNADIIAGTAGGASSVRGYEFDGTNFVQSVATINPFGLSPSGLQVAALDVNGDGGFEFAVGTLSNGNVLVKVYDASATQIGSYTAATGVTSFGLGAVDLDGNDNQELMVGVARTGGGAGTDQIDVLDPVFGTKIDGFNAFAVLIGGITLAGV
jgi:hypothetical protein